MMNDMFAVEGTLNIKIKPFYSEIKHSQFEDYYFEQLKINNIVCAKPRNGKSMKDKIFKKALENAEKKYKEKHNISLINIIGFNGCPDILTIINEEVVFCEIKSENDTVRICQLLWMMNYCKYFKIIIIYQV